MFFFFLGVFYLLCLLGWGGCCIGFSFFEEEYKVEWLGMERGSERTWERGRI